MSFTDSGGQAHSVTTTESIAVGDAALAAAAVPVTATEGKTFSGNMATFTDANPAATSADFTATIDWGDGTRSDGTIAPATGSLTTSATVTGNHLYAEEGSYSPTVTINDADGASAAVKPAASVIDAPLTLTVPAVTSTAAVKLTQAFATFTDADPGGVAADYTATIDWGDGTSAVPDTSLVPGASITSANGVFSVPGSHVYAQDGKYTLSVTLSDAGGAMAAATAPVIIDQAPTGLAAKETSPGSSSAQPLSVNENGTLTGVVSASDPDGHPLSYTLVSGPANAASFSLQANGTFVYVPKADTNGADQFTFQASDGLLTSDAVVTLTVNPVNQPPSFTAGPSETLNEATTAVEQTVSGWATNIKDGPGDPNTNTLGFTVTNDNNSLFAVQPAIDASGKLTYTPAANEFGTADVTVQLTDGGSTANGGQNTSAPQTFSITVNFVNQPPSFIAGANQTVAENVGPQTAAGWATNISPGPPSQDNLALSFLVTSDSNPGLFSTPPAIDPATGNLTYTPATDAYGSATITVALKNNGGTANGGKDTSPTQTFTITVNQVNLPPSFTPGGNVTVSENAGPQYVAGWASQILPGQPGEAASGLAFNVTYTSSTPGLLDPPAIDSQGNLTFMPTANDYGTATLTVTLTDSLQTAATGSNAAAPRQFVIAVAPPFTAATTTTTVSGTEGAPLSATLATFNDTTPGTYTASIDWGDGQSSTDTLPSSTSGDYTVTGTHTYAEEGNDTILVRVSDPNGNIVTTTVAATVSDAAVAAMPASLTAVEGASTAFNVATFTDPAGAEAIGDYSATIAWGDGGTTTGASISLNSGIFTVSGTHTYAEQGAKSPVVTISHDSSAPVTATASINVSDPSVVAMPATLGAVEGASGTFNIATFTDPGGAELVGDYAATIAWGDGTTTTGATISLASGIFTVSGAHAYAEEGAKSPVVTITHDTSSPVTITASITVSDPSVVATPATLTAVEGASATFNVATFTDPGGAEVVGDYSATIAWGDGTQTSNATIALNSGVFTISGTHTYAEEGSKSPVVAISHHSSSPVTAIASISVSDPSVVATPATLSAVEGASATFNVATFTDPGGAEALTDYAATIAWGDGTTTTGATISLASDIFTVSGAHIYAEEGAKSPVVTIAHDSSTAVTTTASISVSDPSIIPTPATLAAIEGGSQTFNVATFTDPGGTELVGDYAATIAWGDGTPTSNATIALNSGVFTISGMHTYAEQGANAPVITITHDSSTAVTVTASVSVSDPSVVATPATLGAVEGASQTFNVATFTDPGGAEVVGDYTATIAWGDGATTTGATISLASGIFTVSGAHTYTEEGAKSPVVTIAHDSATAVTTTASISVSDATLSATAVPVAATEGATFSGNVATFTDANPAGAATDYTASIVWGDGATTAGTVGAAAGGGFAVSGSHTYAAGGTMAVTVVVSDVGGSTASVNSQAAISALPSQGAGATLYQADGAALSGVPVATFTHGDGTTPVAAFAASIDWGDGATTAGTVSEAGGTYSVVGTHTYAQAGDFTVRASVAEGGASSAIVGQALIGTPHQQYVMAVYEDVLGRAADSGGLAYWTQLLDSGAPITDVANQFAHSDEYYAKFVIEPAYLKLLGRAADQSGVAYWTKQMDGGVTDQQLEADLVSSVEFYKNAGGSNTAWIDAVYKLLLGRAADASGENYWNGQLNAGQTLNQVAQGVAGSKENNTQLINDDYFHYLGRAADPAGLDFWLQEFADGKTNEDVIAGFTGAVEYYTKHTS